eukprot:TRINITY_DN3260_c0_g1_i6.p1 TRINITY_DN3260_c0_g1~~TRINITY_DN3260_c0_g1_i6.p1  ORF type:complete len:980 (-),score=135.90 TRINITY_DN3260_c0_g1_i6:302-3241(-)
MGQEQQGGFLPFHFRFGKQFYALFIKNVLIAIRNWKATVLRLLASFLFLFLVYILDLAIQADNQNSTQFKSVKDPVPELVNHIPRCEDDLYHNQDKPCWDFLFSPNTSVIAQELVRNIRLGNDPVIEEQKVRGFETPEDTDEWLLDNPETVQAALHFRMDDYTDPTFIDFIVQFNTSVKFFRSSFQDPQEFIQLPIQLAAHREVTKYFLAQQNMSINAYEISISPFAHPQIETFSIVGSTSGTFLFAANMFGFVALLSNIIVDKEIGLKTAMVTMGLLDSSYWMSWFIYEFLFSFVSALLMVIFGLIFQFDMFLNNNFGCLLILFWLFQMAMSSLAMLISSFLHKSSIAVYLGFAVFILGWIMQIVVAIASYPFQPKYYKDFGGIITIIFALCPWTLFAKGIDDLGQATATSDDPGISWGQRYSYCKNLDEVERDAYVTSADEYVDMECVFSLGQIYLIFFGQWLVYFILTIYLDNVIPNENGVRRKPWYFLMPTYWVGSSTLCTRPQLKQPLHRQNSYNTQSDSLLLDEDVLAEEEKMMNLRVQRQDVVTGASNIQPPSDLAVEIYGLQRRFGSKFWAVKGTWFSIRDNQLFCLLGPNGAGKTTTINCLTGIIPTSGGDAVICGHRLSNPGGLDRIRSMIGVCPQFDKLYHELTGKEHLWIYSQIKGLPNRTVEGQISKLLDQVKLLYAGGQRTGSYSGGMRRRLSVAIALLGDPKVVFLDEPTTGMDPIARRYVWDIIQDAKKGRAIVLTTHSMEEADILGDVVGIMARGRLRCLGSSLRLKQKFGAGYLLGVSVVPQQSASAKTINKEAQEKAAKEVKEFFNQQMDLKAVSEDKAYIHFVIPKDKEERLPQFLALLEEKKDELKISDIQLSLTTLQDVFLKIAKEVEVQHARQAGTMSTLVLPEGQRVLVQPGQEFTTSPQGVTYNIRWNQDDDGNLVIVEATPLLTTTPRGGVIPGVSSSIETSPILRDSQDGQN